MKYKYLTQINLEPNRPHWKRPIVDVELSGPKGKFKTIALIDSGADYSLFNIQIASAIGIELESCRKEGTMGIEGSGKEIFISEVKMKVEHLEPIKVEAGFIDSRSVIGLIGQIGFFDLHRVKFERDHNAFEISAVGR